MTKKDEKQFQKADKCQQEQEYNDKDGRARDHCHVTSKSEVQLIWIVTLTFK